MPNLYVRKGAGWHEVQGMVDVRVQRGEYETAEGKKHEGEIIGLIMDYEPHCAAQKALRKLREMEPRIIDLRVLGEEIKADISIILIDEETDDAKPQRYALIGRLLGMRPLDSEVLVKHPRPEDVMVH